MNCNVDTVDHFNNMKIYPRLQSILRKNYFRFYKVNLNRECPFWSDDSRCAIRYCHVEPCLDFFSYGAPYFVIESSHLDADVATPCDIELGIRLGQSYLHGAERSRTKVSLNGLSLLYEFIQGGRRIEARKGFREDIPAGMKGHPLKNNLFEEDMSVRYSEGTQDCNHDLDDELGYLNTTISADVYEEFARWEAYDDAQDNFCDTNEEDDDIEYVDLLLNPERYTGYKGKSAHRIWHSIYMENCFRPKNSYGAYIQTSKLSAITYLGMDTCYLLQVCVWRKGPFTEQSLVSIPVLIYISVQNIFFQNSLISHPDGKWGANLEEFHRRFDPELTAGEGPQWLKNLYFLYLLELRALAKAAPYLMREEYFTGNDQEDVEVRQAIKDFLNVVRSFPDHFNESSMFTGGKQAKKLKEEFRQHFRNISRIMDCVGCDKCKLWGKLQIQGLGTALKILFSGKFDAVDPSGADLSQMSKNKFQLQRSEIVALFNAFGRLSTSIFELEQFREMMR
uniref:(California timema) hypothetical protein n=1 Tax=Timema californicum TaxID=61474 RepID=A0A7R9IXQ4_TIMCA|nr:unnamed protein product [Timema californicum]